MNPNPDHDGLYDPDPIVRAKAIQDLVEQHAPEYVCGQGQDFRDWLVERANLPISGKTIDRYLRLLEIPEAVQQAVSHKKLTMSLAIRVAYLPDQVQQEIIDRLEAGERAKTVVGDVVQRHTDSTLPAEGTPEAEYRRFLLTAVRTMRAVAGHENEIVAKAMEATKAVEILGQTMDFAKRMKKKEAELNQKRVEAIRKAFFSRH